MRVRVQVAIVAALASSLLWGATPTGASTDPVDPAPVAAVDLGPAAERPASGDVPLVVRAASADVLDDALATVEAHGLEPGQVWEEGVRGFTVAGDTDIARMLRVTPGLAVETDDVVTLSGAQVDPPWGLDRIDQRSLPLDRRYTSSLSGVGVRAYVLDSGINPIHTDFTGRIGVGAFINFGDGTGVNDCLGHGTHVAGTIGGTTAGVAKGVVIVPVKVFSCLGTTSDSAVITGINWIIADHQLGQPAVVNMSLGGAASPAVDAAVAAMIADGITVVAAAGNDWGANACNYSPARVPAAITVGATSNTDVVAGYSNRGPCVDLFAPGSDIVSAGLGSATATAVKSGTSMASPHVAGTAALVLEAYPTASPAQVWDALSSQASGGVPTGALAGAPARLLYVAQNWSVPPEPPFTGIEPARLFESRPGQPQPTVDGRQNGVGRVGAGKTIEVPVAGRGLVPPNAGSVVLNVTMIDPAADGYVTVYPCGPSAPDASSVNAATGKIVANTVVTKLDGNGSVCVFAFVTTDLIVDVTGWFPLSGGFEGIVPARLYESRPGQRPTVDGWQDGTGVRPDRSSTPVDVSTRGVVPPGATAAVLNVTVTNPSTSGFVTVYPCGPSKPPDSSSLNYVAGQTVANAVVSRIGDQGRICVFTTASTDLVVDVTGYFSSPTAFVGVDPARFYESRPGQRPTVDGSQNGTGMRPVGSTEIDVLGRTPIPPNARAVVVNVTVTNPVGSGFVTVYPCGSPKVPNASSLNFVAGQTVANAAVSKIGEGGKVCVYTLVPTDLVVDVTGWFP